MKLDNIVMAAQLQTELAHNLMVRIHLHTL